MPAEVLKARVTAQIDHPFVVFLIGMRVNNLRHVRKWTTTASAMPKMLSVLYQYPEKGFMGGETFVRAFPLEIMMMTYWRSFEALEHFARAKDEPHLGPWLRFHQQVGTDGSVGIWHETYQINPGQYESVYANMPLFGLAKAAGKAVPVGAGQNATARQRMQRQPTPDLITHP